MRSIVQTSYLQAACITTAITLFDLCRCDREDLIRAESGMRRMLTNPFKSVIPLIGDYDINVLLEALKLRQCRVSLHAVFNPKVSLAVA